MEGEGGGSCEASANEYICAHGSKIHFGDLTPWGGGGGGVSSELVLDRELVLSWRAGWPYAGPCLAELGDTNPWQV